VSGAFAVALLRNVRMSGAIVRYIEEVEATLVPFGGRLVVHGGAHETLEGSWPHDLVVVGFPDRARARAWYGSPAYQAILELRTAHAECDVILIDAVGDGYRATDVLKARDASA
jgi:uncharacterized protein (DUF1330 family)